MEEGRRGVPLFVFLKGSVYYMGGFFRKAGGLPCLGVLVNPLLKASVKGWDCRV